MAHIWKMIAQRLLLGLATLLVISVVIFGAVELLPGDVAREILGQGATEETVAALREELGLNRPVYVRYFEWLFNASRGEFGNSLASGRSISELTSTRLGNTLFLAVYAACIAVPLSLAFGIVAALKRNTLIDRSINVGALTSISSPEFFLAYVLVFLLAQTGYFPSIANIRPDMWTAEKLYLSFLPALTLTLVVTAHMMRMTRAALINLLASPYIEMARLKGASELRIIVRHALPNALAPIINVVALNLAYLVTGVVVVEVVFVYPGLGQLMVDSVAKRDVPVVQACALIFACAYVVMNLLADVLSTLSNPRLVHAR
ncbi:ABC transporter permease [Leisingera sp. HS039]|uniref:ABC transporter permease n=1 Tax=unclassified Leisingera TaxID=2614906 RepID=UPI001071172B|nr:MULTISPECIES: ABC transporter permease [unclassified Leisingera]MBQ4824544.1 ABC transporter permease [Leisingera sp. HS039]QBR38776.1 ABC transporter permease [Leisingera sp. NJS201]